MPIMPTVYKVASSTLGAIEQTSVLQSLGKSFNKNPEKVLGLMTVGSIVVKDGIGCYKYVTQSMHNEKIPEDKRKFVAALDLTNGVLMIAAQIGMFFAMRKFSEPIFNKLFQKSFNEKTISNVGSRIRLQQEQAGETIARKLNIEKAVEEGRKSALDLFKFIADIGAATIIGKRVIVPFIATPLADKVKKKMDEKEGIVAPKENELKTEESKRQPSVTGQRLDLVNYDTNLLNQYRHAIGYRR